MSSPKRFLTEQDKADLLEKLKSKIDIKQDLSLVKKLLYVGEDGEITVLALGNGLGIQNGKEAELTISDEGIKASVNEYLEEHPVEGGGINFETGNALELVDGVLNVKTTDVAEVDNTLPITSSGVNTIVGNIGAILDTI